MAYVRSNAPSEWGEECVIWFLSIGNHGYGQIGWEHNGERGHILAHRLAYLMFVGEIPDEMTVDHLCRIRPCWNPRHLRLLTNLANATDNGMKSRTHCVRGHPYDEANTRWEANGHRKCRTCDRMWKRGYRVGPDKQFYLPQDGGVVCE